jgi:hypothetical protein
MYKTNLVQTLQNAGLSVYVYTLMNEFASQAYDFFSDATVQINWYVTAAGVDGLITEFPATARRYKSNNCMNMGNSTPVFMDPARAGDLMQTIMMKTAQPPALAPMPLLTDSDVAEPPLPPARSNSSTSPTHSGATRMHAHATHILVLVILPMLFAWCSLV